ncbi:MAG: gamma-glutamyltransferase [Chloroflexi bacterium]|nr:gamma-glutamyltransferase [Chloroflexota bacterium]
MKGVVAAPQVEAVEAGRRMLLAGGNAVDAAVATAFAQGVVDPQMNSLGGWGVAQVYHAASGQHLCIDFHGWAPLKATPDMFAARVKRKLRFDLWEVEGWANQLGYLSVVCPGNLRGYHEVHRRFGKLPWAAVLDPAIELAEVGFEVPGELADLWQRPPLQEGQPSMRDILTATPAAAKLFTKNGRPYEAGELFRNPDYANTLREVAKNGPEVFYTGWIGERIAEDFARNGGLLTAEDLREYRMRVGEPVRSSYRGYQLTGNPPPCSCVQVMEVLKILEGFDVKDMGFGTADYWHVMALAQKASFVDRARYLGDPEFQPVPVDLLLSDENASGWREKIIRNVRFAVPGVQVGEPAHTTTVSAMDAEGNAVAITHTLSTPASGVVVEGLGFMFNNAMQAFYPYPGHPNSIAPGKARATGIAPTFVFKDGAPYLVASAPGATKILTGVLQAIVHVLDFGMTPAEAVSAPRVHCEGEQVDLEARAYYAVKDAMAKKGHKVVKSLYSFDPFFALVHMVARDPATGRLTGAADPRGRGGLALVDR